MPAENDYYRTPVFIVMGIDDAITPHELGSKVVVDRVNSVVLSRSLEELLDVSTAANSQSHVSVCIFVVFMSELYTHVLAYRCKVRDEAQYIIWTTVWQS